ncbi:MAG TPA: hypothetical protein PKC94_23450 [Leptospiraceae bacterium]|nr:hypothetical protein [Leptospiraceae bacterium]HNF57489.1 hypothetical protein [Leptospiraceae bacterium]
MSFREGYISNQIDLQAGAVPSTPPAGHFRLYRRNGSLTYLDDTGIEHPMTENSSGSLISLKEDFLSGYLNGSVAEFVLATATGGANALSAYESSPTGTMRMGIFAASVSTGAASRTAGILNATLLRFGDGICTLTIFARLSALATVADNFTMLLGFIDNTASATITDGVFFRYNASNANLIGVASNNGTQSTITLSKTMDTSWNRYDIIINANATLASFYVNSVLTGTLSTNIPRTAGRETSIGFGLHRSTGGTAKTLFMDSFELLAISTNPR